MLYIIQMSVVSSDGPSPDSYFLCWDRICLTVVAYKMIMIAKMRSVRDHSWHRREFPEHQQPRELSHNNTPGSYMSYWVPNSSRNRNVLSAIGSLRNRTRESWTLPRLRQAM